MRFQKVSVDVWRVIVTSGSCLFLAFMAWVFLKLAYACVWLPGYLQKQEQEEAKMEEQMGQVAGACEEGHDKAQESTQKDKELKKTE